MGSLCRLEHAGPSSRESRGFFFVRTGGRVLRASSLAATRAAGARGSEIDYAIASEPFIPYVLSSEAVVAAPWNTSCGLLMRFRGAAAQLLTRSLDLP
eukprot:8807624-Pyramimonas_sp.AAC.1